MTGLSADFTVKNEALTLIPSTLGISKCPGYIMYIMTSLPSYLHLVLNKGWIQAVMWSDLNMQTDGFLNKHGASQDKGCDSG